MTDADNLLGKCIVTVSIGIAGMGFAGGLSFSFFAYAAGVSSYIIVLGSMALLALSLALVVYVVVRKLPEVDKLEVSKPT